MSRGLNPFCKTARAQGVPVLPRSTSGLGDPGARVHRPPGKVHARTSSLKTGQVMIFSWRLEAILRSLNQEHHDGSAAKTANEKSRQLVEPEMSLQRFRQLGTLLTDAALRGSTLRGSTLRGSKLRGSMLRLPCPHGTAHSTAQRLASSAVNHPPAQSG